MRALAAVVAITWMCGPVARADRAGADRLSAEANALAANRDFVGAAAKFRAAFGADARVDLLCNVGIAYQRAKEWPRAQMYLSQCLVRGGTLERSLLDSVRVLLTSVEDKLRAGDYTPVDIVVAQDGARVAIDAFDKEDAFVGSRNVWLPYGSHSIAVSAEGYVSATRTVDAASHEPQTLQVSLERVPAPRPPPPDRAPVTISRSAPHRSLLLPAALSGVTIAIGAFAIAEWLSARGHADDANQLAVSSTTADAYQAAVDAAHHDRTLALGTGIMSATLAGATAYLWVRWTKRPGHVEVTPRPNGAAISFGGRF